MINRYIGINDTSRLSGYIIIIHDTDTSVSEPVI